MPLAATFALLFLARSAPADRYRFVLYGDCRDGHEVHRKLVALMMKEHPAFVIQTGDLVHKGTNEDNWKTYDEITGEMRSKIPIYPARGNHDFGGDGYDSRIDFKIESGDKKHYSFTRGKWHFVSLDVDEHENYGPSGEEYKWMVADLEKASKAKQDIAVFFHVPPYSIGSHGSDKDVRATLCPVFAKYGVTLVLNGHDHIYYRTQRDGITYIVSGGGGAPLYPVNPKEGAIDGDQYLSTNHIVVFDVDGDTMKAEALKADGTPFDHFEVHGRSH
ncbi:MAG TPA: metallophosphoesterase [Fimbriimonadaceae bacterium]|nr:metallophosphoesterase [Fimbriimonadaceae bacterium]